MKIALRFPTRRFFCFPGDANLSIQFNPIKCQRRVRIGFELHPLFALVIRKKNETVLIESFQSHHAYGWFCVAPSGGEAHRVDIANFGLNRRSEPVRKLFDRIRIEVAPAETARGVLVTGSRRISWRLHLRNNNRAQYGEERNLSIRSATLSRSVTRRRCPLCFRRDPSRFLMHLSAFA